MRLRNFVWLGLSLVGVTSFAAVWPAESINAFYVMKLVDPETFQLPRKEKLPPAAQAKFIQPLVQLLIRSELPERKMHSLLERDYYARIHAVGVSTDGSRVVCHVGGSDNERGDHSWIIMMNADGSNEQIIPTVKLRLSVEGTPVPLPDGHRIGLVFADSIKHPGHASEPYWQIATLDTKSHAITRLGKGIMPHWSPDGKSIVYTAIKQEDPKTKLRDYQLWMMDAGGKNARPIAPEGTCNASFSPDGKQIAYVAIDDQYTNLFIADADGKNARKLTTVPAIYASPRWLPDGSRILFASGRDLMRSINQANGSAKTKPSGKTKGASPKAKGASPKANNKPAQSNANRDPSPAKPQSFAEMKPTAIFVISADGSSIQPVSPRIPEGKQTIALLDEDAIEAIRLGIKPHTPPQANKPKTKTNAGPVPPGHTMTFQGTKAFLRDSSGKLTPAPDGYYQLPNGAKVWISGGHKTMRNFSDGDD